MSTAEMYSDSLRMQGTQTHGQGFGCVQAE